MASYWMETQPLPAFEPLRQDLKTDVLIIGGGLIGLLCAYLLRQEKVDLALVEARRILNGVSGHTTAKITVQHDLIYDRLLRCQGPEKARMYLHANQAALEAYRDLSREIPCDFEEKESIVYARSGRDRLEREIRAMERLGLKAAFRESLPLPLSIVGAVSVPRQAQFHPLRFAAGLAKGLNIYENTRVLSLSPGLARTNQGNIRCKSIIVATHFPFWNRHGSYFLKLYQDRSYLLALENAPDVQGMYVDENAQGLSFRNHGNMLLLGGGSRRTGKQGGAWTELEDFAARHYRNAKPVFRWAAQDCMSLDGIPYIGPYSRLTPTVYTATGFNKWGMTGAMAAALILRDQILGRQNPWAEVFSPSRSMLHRQLAVNAFESAVHLLKPTVPRCPHMGCALTYNRAERSWDCPCHGSRFSQDGALIDNPANCGLEERKHAKSS